MKNWSNYQGKTYNDDVCNLLVEFLDTYSATDSLDRIREYPYLDINFLKT